MICVVEDNLGLQYQVRDWFAYEGIHIEGFGSIQHLQKEYTSEQIATTFEVMLVDIHAGGRIDLVGFVNEVHGFQRAVPMPLTRFIFWTNDNIVNGESSYGVKIPEGVKIGVIQKTNYLLVEVVGMVKNAQSSFIREYKSF